MQDGGRRAQADAEHHLAMALRSTPLKPAARSIERIVTRLEEHVGDWWTDEHVRQAATDWSGDDEAHYSSDYVRRGGQLESSGWEAARTGYALGHIASHNPDYRNFDEVRQDLRAGFGTPDGFEALQAFVREGFEHCRARDVREDRRG